MNLLLLSLVFFLAFITSTRDNAQDRIRLPERRTKGAMSLEEALARRRSVRELKSRSLSWEEIGQLLWAAQGVSHGDELRTAPSAGGRYPLELYVATAEGVYHYEPQRHQVTRTHSRDVRRDLRRAALDQGSLEAPCIFAISAVMQRTAARYGNRAARYVYIEAGHAAQNLLLQVTALGLAAVPVGAFDDSKVQEVLRLPADTVAVYLVPVGR